MSDLFEKAARLKIRFETGKGALAVEDLFDLPLTSATGRTNLDALAIGLDKVIKESSATSFVDNTTTGDAVTKLKFDLVLSVIETKKAERLAAAEKAANSEKKQRLLELISKKQDDALAGKSLEELTAMVNALT